MKTFLFLINLLIFSTFTQAAPEPTIHITHACNGTLGSINYSYEGEDYQIEWSIEGGESAVTRSGPGTLSNLEPGTYELYLLVPGREQYFRYGPYYYNVLDITPNFSVVSNNSCNGITGDASIQVTLNNVHAGYTYNAQLKNSNNQVIQSGVVSGNNHTFSNLVDGNYTIEVSIGEDCSYGEAIILQDEDDCPPRPTMNITHACNGTPGYIDYSYEGEDYQIQWSINGDEPFITEPGAGTLEPAEPGIYTVYLLIPGKFNYTYYGPYTYQVLDLTPAFSTIEGNSCNGVSGDATLKVDVNPMHSGYTYVATLKNSSNQVLQTVTMTSSSHTFTNLSADNYVVEIDAGGICSSSENIVITDEALSFILATTPKTCHDIGGSLQVTLPNWESNTTYTITLTNDDPNTFLGPNNNQTTTFTQTTSTYTLPNVAPGNYTVTVNDGTCSSSQSLTIEAVGVDLIPIMKKQNGICYWEFNASMLGGATATSYTWSFKDHVGVTIPAQSINSLGNQATNILNTSWVKVTATTDDGCVYEKEMDISSELFLNNQLPDIFSFNPTCGQSDGSISVEWISGLGMNNLFNINQAVIKQTPSGTPLQTVNITVFTGNNISSYNAYFGGLAAGTYYVDFITDFDCHTSENLPISVTISDEPIEIEGSVYYVCSENNAYIIVNSPSSGVTYQWKDPNGNIIPGANTASLTTNITATGIYEVIVDDGAGCTASQFFNVSSTDFGASVSINQPSCGVGGSLNLQLTKEIGLPYTITSSSDPSNPITVNSLGFSHTFPVNTNGTYSITITNALGCSQVLSNLVIQDQGLIVRFQDIQAPTHCQSQDGSLNASNITGGVAPYTYLWNTGANTATIANLELGVTYTVTVTDNNGCTGTASYTFSNSVHAVGTYYSWDGPTCGSGNHGTFYTVLSDPAPLAPLSYKWKNAQGQTIGQSPTLSGIPSGSYSLTVTDANNCEYTHNLYMPNAVPYLANYIPTLEILTKCKNGFDGFSVDYDALTNCSSLNVDIYEIFDYTGILVDQFVMNQNDPSTHTYQGFDLANSQLYYRVEITDCCGNVMTMPIIYFNNRYNPSSFIEYPTVTTAVTPANCSTPGAITMTITGANAPYNCVWEDGFVGNNRTDLLAGTYTVQVIGTGGCPKEEVITIPGSNGGAHLINSFPCDGRINVGAVNITGGQGPYTISWTHNGGASQSGTTLSLVGDYILEITDASGCVTTEYLTIGEQVFEVTSSVVEPSCAGDDGQINLTVNNNSASVTSYNWTGPSSSTYTGHSLNGLIAGTYNYTVIDAHGCTETGNVVVPNNTILNASLSAGCLPQINSITGGKAPYRVVFTALNPNPLQPTYSLDLDATTTYPFGLNNLLEGDYSVAIIDDNGCVFNTTINTFSTVTTTRSIPNIQMRWTRYKQVPPTQTPVASNSDVVKDDLMQQAQNFLADADKLGGHKDHCEKQGEDALTLDYAMQLQHYTLYYYNLRDELIRTVPPEGVDFIEGADLTSLLDWRGNKNVTAAVPGITMPSHSMVTQYDYNARGAIVRANNSDKGELKTYHADNGLLRYSQSSKQVLDNTYSYVLYDDLKRVIEVGEINYSGIISSSDLNNIGALPTGVSSSDRDEWSSTHYSAPHIVNSTPITYFNNVSKPQRYLRNRISYSINHQGVSSSYSYDVHGRVEWMRIYIPNLGDNYIAYDYDIITGLVNKVSYNEYSEDRFFHKFEYDDEKRLKVAYTSKDGIIWDRDVEYDFNANSLMNRMELGDDKIQGLDYVYTINGWTKSVNNPLMHQYGVASGESNDPGNDGFSSGSNSSVMKDVFGYTLGYYQGDFSRGIFEETIDYSSGTNSFYDGKIGAWVNGINIEALTASNSVFNSAVPESFTQRNFSHSAIGQVKSSNLLTTSTNIGVNVLPSMDPANNDAYKSTYAYDENGNIQSLQRYGEPSEGLIDDLSYTYGTGELQNRLLSVTDAENSHAVGDLDHLQEYTYDAVGNVTTIIEKNQLGVTLQTTNIDWRVDGKVKQVDITHHASSIDSRIEFIYDPSGTRVGKLFDPNINVPNDELSTFYVCDEAGKLMSSYKRAFNHDPSIQDFQLKQEERVIYGITRVGLNTNSDYLLSTGSTSEIDRSLPTEVTGLVIRLLDDKVFELVDHLGNVTVTLSDQKILADVGYEAKILSYKQYYPFGWEMPGRKFNSQNYRFGFNGQEQDTEWLGGQAVGFKYRIHDPRIGRFLSIDPLASNFPWNSAYAFAENRVIWSIDLQGGETHPVFKELAKIYRMAKTGISNAVSGTADAVTSGASFAWNNPTAVPGAIYNAGGNAISNTIDGIKEAAGDGIVIYGTFGQIFSNRFFGTSYEINNVIFYDAVQASGWRIVTTAGSAVAGAAGGFALQLVKRVKIKGKWTTIVCDESPLASIVSSRIGCFVAGTSVLTQDSLVNIENIQLGDLVISSPNHSETELITGLNTEKIAHQELELTSNWKKIKLEMIRPNGSIMKIELLRPSSWIEKNVNKQLASVYLSLPEMEIHGEAKVLEISDTAINLATNNLYLSTITGTFTHISRNVYQLIFSDLEEPVSVTSTHPFWSEDRQRWVPAEQLIPNELVKTYRGVTKFIKKNYLPGAYTVYNLEVHNTHNYFVSNLSILVHNVCPERIKNILNLKKQGLNTAFEAEIKAYNKWGDYLEKNLGVPKPKPGTMYRPHAHHIVQKIGTTKYAGLARELLEKHSIDPYFGKANLTWAPNGKGNHKDITERYTYEKLKDADVEGANADDMLKVLKEVGQQMADGVVEKHAKQYLDSKGIDY